MISRSWVRLSKPLIRFQSSAAYDGMMKTIRNDLKINFRLKNDVLEKNVIRSILAESKNLEIEKKSSCSEFDLYDLLAKMIKQRKDSAEHYLREGSPDKYNQLGYNELRECDYLQKYVDQLPLAKPEEVDAKVKDIVEKISEGQPLKNPQMVFAKIPWKSINQDWQASQGMVKESVMRVFKQ